MAAPDAHQLILDAATDRRTLSEADLAFVLRHVAGAGFHPTSLERLGQRGAGVRWQGRVTLSRDRLPPAEAHYLRHVVAGQEWPASTSLSDYLQSIADVALDAGSGILLSRYRGEWHVSVVRRSGALRGPRGRNWILVEYQVTAGHIVTAFQPRHGLRILISDQRTDRRWLRRLT